MIEHSLHSVLICDIHTARFPLDCSRAAEQLCVHVRYSECAAVCLQRAVMELVGEGSVINGAYPIEFSPSLNTFKRVNFTT